MYTGVKQSEHDLDPGKEGEVQQRMRGIFLVRTHRGIYICIQSAVPFANVPGEVFHRKLKVA